MKEIQLRNAGQVALVDDEDYERIAQYSWYAHKARDGATYAERNLYDGGKGYTLAMHRAVKFAVKGQKVDHKNGNGLDNRKENLRFATSSTNAQGFRKKKTGFTSRFRGVCKDKSCKSDRWTVSINPPLGKRSLYLGFFDSETKAARAYNAAAYLFFGEFAQFNVIEEAAA